MSKNYFFLFFVLFFSPFYFGHTQDLPRDSDFFSKDFANQSVEDNETPISNNNEQSIFEDLPEEIVSESTEESNSVKAAYKSLDSEMFETDRNDMEATSTEYKITAIKLWFLKTDLKQSETLQNEQEKLEKRLKLKIAVSQQLPPKELGITTSPAWFIETSQGNAILEGVNSISEFIDGWGNFIDAGSGEMEVLAKNGATYDQE